MGRLPPASCHDHVASFTDPRCAKARHQLSAIFGLAICAVISGAAGWEASEADGQAQAEGCGQFGDWPPGMPGHDTFRRV